MPRAVTPRAAPFTINAGPHSWRFVDQRDVERANFRMFRQAQRIRNRELRRFYEGIQVYDGVDLCDLDQRVVDAVQRRYDRAVEREPGLTFDEFEERGGALVHDGCQDPRKRMLNFLVRDANTGRWIGGIHLGNIDVERDTDGNLQATAFFWAGLVVPDGVTDRQVWIRIMRHIVRNDITFRNGRVLDIVGFDFLGEPWYRWARRTNPKLTEILSGLTADVDEENDDVDADVIRKIRRKGVPRASVVR